MNNEDYQKQREEMYYKILHRDDYFQTDKHKYDNILNKNNENLIGNIQDVHINTDTPSSKTEISNSIPKPVIKSQSPITSNVTKKVSQEDFFSDLDKKYNKSQNVSKITSNQHPQETKKGGLISIVVIIMIIGFCTMNIPLIVIGFILIGIFNKKK